MKFETMETKVNTSFNKARAFAQMIKLIRCLLGCLNSVWGHLSGKLKGCVVFSPCFIHDRRFALYPGGASRDKINRGAHRSGNE